MDSLGVEKINLYKTTLENEYLIAFSDEELAIKLYQVEGEENK